jgi:hypothetical protein
LGDTVPCPSSGYQPRGEVETVDLNALRGAILVTGEHLIDDREE